MSKYIFALPPLKLSIPYPDERSLYVKSFAKGDFTPNQSSFRDYCDTTATTQSKTMTKTRTTPTSLVPSRNLSPIPHHDIPHISFKTIVLQHPTATGSMTSRTDTSTIKTIKASSKLSEIPIFTRVPARTSSLIGGGDPGSEIRSYLDFLSSNSKNDPNDYLSRMRQRVILQKEAEEITRNESLNSQMRQMISREHRQMKKDLLLMTPRDKNYMKEIHTPKQKEKGADSPREISFEAGTPSKMNRRQTNVRGLFFRGTVLAGSDEQMARDLADEIECNYEAFRTRAAKYKKLNAKLQDLLATEGLVKVFNSKENFDIPLSMRIFKDVTKYIDVPLSNKERSLTTRNMSVCDSSGRISIVKRFRTKLRLVKLKYESYQKVNKALVEITVNYKIEEVKAWEGRLAQVQDEFFKKKTEVLDKVAKIDLEKYRELKQECEGIENMISARMIQFKDDDDLEETVNMKINKELDEIRTNWQKKIEKLS